jgi:cytochrome P450
MQSSPYNPLEPGFAENPFEQYERIREGERVQQTAFGPLLVHRYRDVTTLLRDTETSVNVEDAARTLGRSVEEITANRGVSDRRMPPVDAGGGLQIMGDRRLVVLDPPDHTRIRRLFSRAFTPSRVARLRDRVQILVKQLIEDLASGATGEPVDLVAELALPLPFQVICELLGMPDTAPPELHTWTKTVSTWLIEPFGDQIGEDRVLVARKGLSAYLNEAIEAKRQEPGDDLLSAMVAAEEDGDRLSREEIIEQTTSLFLAGHETTMNLIGNGIAALVRHRDQFERLAADPELDANAVEELARWDAAQATRRITLTDVDLGGAVVPAGHLVITLLGAANRDPEHWGPTAGELDLGREDAGTHLSFGSGIHHCLGAALARLEGREAVPTLIRRFPRMELATDNLPWRQRRVVLRGLEALPVVLEP